MYMEKKIILKEDFINEFYKKIHYYKFLKLFKTRFTINYKNKEYKKYNLKAPKEIHIILKMVDILNAENRREKYELIHDYACEYLDSEFQNKNVCGFKNNMCSCNRAKIKSKQLSSCCESGKTRTICHNFNYQKKCCNIQSLGCKLFICPHLRKKGVKYPIKKIPYLHYFLSPRQKLICITSIFQDKKITVDKFLKFYKMP